MSLTEKFPSVNLSHKPTPLERLDNISRKYGTNVWIKRDDCTGLATGGNKSRQLEYYIGQARAEGADTLLTTGATQSNHVRMTVAAARKLGMDVEVQLEHRVDRENIEYHQSGNPYLIRLMGARVHYYPEGEDEAGADKAMEDRAEELRAEGKKPYVIPLSNAHMPYGALGYVEAAEETLGQLNSIGIKPAMFVVPTGSASTHSGFLTGLRALGDHTPVHGICVRRDAVSQHERVKKKIAALVEILDRDFSISDDDIICDDRFLAPGYGVPGEATLQAIQDLAYYEGILLDPTYTGKTFAGLLDLLADKQFTEDEHVVFLHTGGAVALFGYPELVYESETGQP